MQNLLTSHLIGAIIETTKGQSPKNRKGKQKWQ
nr:MAG TPA: hypothetical protein [Caudoviricetes sp.]